MVKENLRILIFHLAFHSDILKKQYANNHSYVTFRSFSCNWPKITILTKINHIVIYNLNWSSAPVFRSVFMFRKLSDRMSSFYKLLTFWYTWLIFIIETVISCSQAIKLLQNHCCETRHLSFDIVCFSIFVSKPNAFIMVVNGLLLPCTLDFLVTYVLRYLAFSLIQYAMLINLL